MGIQTEVDNIGRAAWGSRFSDVIREVSVDTILSTGTSMTRDSVTELINTFAEDAKKAERSILMGGINIADAKRLQTGWMEVCRVGGGRGATRIIELVAESAGYDGTLHESPNIIEEYHSLIETTGELFTAIIIKPLPQILVVSNNDNSTWQGAIFRQTIIPYNTKQGTILIAPIGLLYMRSNPGQPT